ncbi:MAG TPA: PstS family phosphate ABC transporter substrate-binding protein [Chitinophagaceae bacterium]|nr:PstS family phosphate ABC transporter substrate-binding protein [Chitinophagaceae bacterium]
MTTKAFMTVSIALAGIMFTSCGSKPEENKDGLNNQKLTGEVNVDGSSTVYPITEAVAEEFRKVQPDVNVKIGVSGTGGGFKKFGRGETDINDASRPIKKAEDSIAKANNVSHVELMVAYDGMAVVVNPQNDWCADITVEELKMLWEPDAQNKITKWSQVRKGWPDKEIHLFGPGVESGTYDYFTEAIVGKSLSSRGDYTASEDDNVLVQGISSDKYALGFFGLAYYEENADKLKLVGIDDGKDDNGAGPILPSVETVKNKTYAPLGRPLFIYVNSTAGKRPAVQEFVRFYLDNMNNLSKDVGYIPLADDELAGVKSRWDEFLKSLTPAK